MERFVIVMPVDTSAYLLPCDDGDTCKLETLQKLVGGPIEMADTCLAASWAREDVDSIQMAVTKVCDILAHARALEASCRICYTSDAGVE